MLQSALNAIRRASALTFEEIYPGAEELCVSGSEGRFTHELIVPFVRSPASTLLTERPQSFTGAHSAAHGTRKFAPGSEWLYVKVYCGEGLANFVIRTLIEPLVRRVAAQQLATRWFFLRYADPDFHLRVRFQSPLGKSGELMELVGESFQASVRNSLIARVVYDTYLPELERYGGLTGLDVVHDIFHIDSNAAIKIIGVYGDTAEQPAPSAPLSLNLLLSVSQLLMDFGYDGEAKLNWLEQTVGQVPGAQLKQRSAAYRRARAAVERILGAGLSGADASIREALTDRSSQLRPAVARLRDVERTKQLTVSWDQMTASLIHVSLNRLVRGVYAVEADAYDFLMRFERAEIGRRTVRLENADTPAPQAVIEGV